MKLLLLLPAILAAFQLSAQFHNDCANALIICNKQPIVVDSLYGAGADLQELNEATCFLNGGIPGTESNSFWVKFTAAQAGDLYFLITPEKANDDFDFVLFQLKNGGVCGQKQMLRCMAAGESVGSSSAACLGPTGLMPGETDIEEDAGCSESDDNNFLAPVALATDFTYVLCIQNFSSKNGFRIEFCGTALLGCETEICSTIAVASPPEQPGFQLLHLFPNPVSAGFINLEFASDHVEQLVYTLVNTLGQAVQRSSFLLPQGQSTLTIPVNDLAPGAYWLQMVGEHSIMTRQVIITR